MLSSSELSRYARQLVLPELGLAGQERLRAARALIVGAGGLGSPAALYLAAAGVGTIGIVDDDTVEMSNLHRQIVHASDDVGKNKATSAAETLKRLNVEVSVIEHLERLTTANAADLISGYDLVIDGSDNYATRYAVNDACARLQKVWIYGSVERFAGQVSVFGAAGGPCYRCVFSEPPKPGATANCEEIGVLGAVPGVVGSLQAVEALKCILQVGQPLVGRILQIDFLSTQMRVVALERRADCAACGSASPRVGAEASSTPGPEGGADIEPRELARRLLEPAIHLIDVREPWEWSVARIGKPQLVSMNSLPVELDSLDRSRELVIYCHHGVRSEMAAQWLRVQGFQARSLVGGIDRWSREIDPTVPRY